MRATIVHGKVPKKNSEDKVWTEFIQRLLVHYAIEKNNRTIFDPPVEILPHLFLGNRLQANDKDMLHELGITHIVNCAAGTSNFQDADGKPKHLDGFKYFDIAAEDYEGYNMLKHVEKAYQFIEKSRLEGGKILVHCEQGVNRSGFIVVCYCMKFMEWPLLKALEHCAMKRGLLLTNPSFQVQLVHFARENELLVEHKSHFGLFARRKTLDEELFAKLGSSRDLSV